MSEEIKEVTCNCDGWKKGANQIFHAQIQFTFEHGIKYTGDIWKYCPWCGKSLQPLSICPRCEGTGEYKRLGFSAKKCAVCNGTGKQ